jgi:two-component system sensor histidine kinase BaeS
MRRRLFWAMVAVAFVTLVIAGISGAVLVERSLSQEREDEFFRQAAATGRLIENLVGAGDRPVGAARQVARLRELMETAQLVGGHDYVEALVETPRRSFAIPTDGELVNAVPGVVTDRAVVTAMVDGSEVLAFVRPIEFGNGGRATVVIGRTTGTGAWSVVSGRLVVAALVAVVLAGLLAVWLSRSMAQRLGTLTTAARQIAAGDVTARAPADGGDEVAAVAGAFNEMAAQLENARRRERDFLMSVSHELRTPLTTIRGYAEGLAEDAVPPDDLPRVGSVLAVQADRLSRLVEDLMLLSRLEARQFTLRAEPVDVAAHLKEVVDALRPRADDARVRLLVEDPDPSDVPGTAMLDPDRMAQIVTNLVENALRYTPEGGSVVLRVGGDTATVHYVVTDTGPGIDSSDLPHVFERLHVAQRYLSVRPEGSGLGLSIVKELVGALGGTVEVSSELGVGTTVVVRLPR